MLLGAIIKTIRHIFLFSIFLLLTACANKSYMTKSDKAVSFPSVMRPVTGCMPNEHAFDCDRRAILSMLGEYQVSFNFQ